MVEVMVAVMPFHGHVAPLAAVAEAFLEARHGVRVYTGAAHAERFTAVGARVVTWASAPDFDEHDPSATFPVLRSAWPSRSPVTTAHARSRSTPLPCSPEGEPGSRTIRASRATRLRAAR